MLNIEVPVLLHHSLLDVQCSIFKLKEIVIHGIRSFRSQTLYGINNSRFDRFIANRNPGDA